MDNTARPAPLGAPPTASADAGWRGALPGLMALVALILTVWALRAAAVVVVPVVTSLFIAMAVTPISSGVQRVMPRGLRWLGHAAAMAVVALLLSGFFVGIYLAAQQAILQIPGLAADGAAVVQGAAERGASPSSSAGAALPAAGALLPGGGVAPDGAGSATGAAGPATGTAEAGDPPLPGSLGRLAEELGDAQVLGYDMGPIVERVARYAVENAAALAQTVVGTAAGLISGIVLVFFLVLLMLIEGPTWRDKATAAFTRRGREGWTTTFALTAQAFRWYALVRTALGAITASLYALWLGLFGIELLFVWWVLAFLLNYIPTLGSIIAGILPVAYAVATTDATTALWVALGILAIEQVMGNFVEARVTGKQLSISPLVTFVALILFGWMWGIIGALLAVPIVVLLVIALAQTSQSRWMALLLSDFRDMEGLEGMTRPSGGADRRG